MGEKRSAYTEKAYVLLVGGKFVGGKNELYDDVADALICGTYGLAAKTAGLYLDDHPGTHQVTVVWSAGYSDQRAVDLDRVACRAMGC